MSSPPACITSPCAHLLSFELFPARSLHLLLFTAVRNAPSVLSRVLSRELDVALLNARLVVGVDALHVAANRALHGMERLRRLRAASLHAELVLCLHGGRHVGEALRVMGPPPHAQQDSAVGYGSPARQAPAESAGGDGGAADAGTAGTADTVALLVCAFDASPELLARVAACVKGEPTALTEFYPAGLDAHAVRELYRVGEEELAGRGAGALSEAVIGRIAVAD